MIGISPCETYSGSDGYDNSMDQDKKVFVRYIHKEIRCTCEGLIFVKCVYWTNCIFTNISLQRPNRMMREARYLYYGKLWSQSRVGSSPFWNLHFASENNNIYNKKFAFGK